MKLDDAIAFLSDAQKQLENKPVTALRLVDNYSPLIGIGEDLPLPASDEVEGRKEWQFQLENAHWRIIRHGQHLVGRSDAPELIEARLGMLLGKRVIRFQVISRFMDVEFLFEDGYKFTTCIFFDEKNQWCLSSPVQSLVIDFDTVDSQQMAERLATNFLTEEAWYPMETLVDNLIVHDISYKSSTLIITFERDLRLRLYLNSWFLEQSGHYVLKHRGKMSTVRLALSNLIGKSLKYIEITEDMFNARFVFDEDFVIHTFMCGCGNAGGGWWEICDKEGESLVSVEPLTMAGPMVEKLPSAEVSSILNHS